MKRTFNLLFLALILVLIVNMVGRPLPSAQAAGAQLSRTMENVPVRVPALVYAVWGSSARDVYAVGETVGAPLLYHNDGTGWTETAAPGIIYVDQNATGANNGIGQQPGSSNWWQKVSRLAAGWARTVLKRQSHVRRWQSSW
jgi:hypothetical protein